jgi:hypothetical protein
MNRVSEKKKLNFNQKINLSSKSVVFFWGYMGQELGKIESHEGEENWNKRERENCCYHMLCVRIKIILWNDTKAEGKIK